MAQFNPGVPDTRDPNYLSYSHGIPQPESNKTAVYQGQAAEHSGKAAQYMGEADQYLGKAAQYGGESLEAIFKGIGDIFSSGVKAADSYYKKSIDRDVYTAVDAERNSYTQELERVKSGETVPSVPGSTGGVAGAAPGTPTSLLNPSQEPSQPGIEKGLERANTIVQARANDKLSETAYIGQLNSIVKGLRSQYPGYRDYIDQKISEVTGIQPANAYVKSLVQDVNAMIAGSKNDRDKVVDNLLGDLRTLNKEGVYGADTAASKLMRDGDVDYALSWINKQKSSSYRMKQEQEQWSHENAGTANSKLAAEKAFDKMAPGIVDTHFDTIFMNLPIGKGTAKDLSDVINNHLQGTGPRIDSVSQEKIAMAIRSRAEDVYTAMRAKAISTGVYQAMGSETAEKALQSQVTRFTRIADLIQKGEWGAAGSSLRANKTMIADATQGLYTSEHVGQDMITAKSLEDIGPNAFGKFWERMVIDDKKFGDRIGQYMKNRDLKYLTQPPEILKGKPATYRQGLLDAQDKLKDKEGNVNPEVYKATMRTFPMFTQPGTDDPVKLNIATAAFSPSNRGMLEEIQKDYRNANGKKIAGQIDVYEEFTNQAVTNEMVRLSKTGTAGAKALANYKDWAYNEFKNVLFRQDIATLNDIQKSPGMSISWVTNDQTGEAKFVVNRTAIPKFNTNDPAGNLPSRRPDVIATRRTMADDTVERLNRGIASIANITKATGGDINAEMVRLFTSSGVNLKGVGGLRIPEDMLRSVVSGSKSNFSSEETPTQPQRGSLGEFLRNPGRGVPARVQNAPVTSSVRPRGNLSDEDLLGMEVIDLPTPGPR